jgi:hypothetical protein
MRAYHFISSHYALDDLRRRRLKIARLDELNDPFELWAIAQPDRRLRQALRRTKGSMAGQYGVLCFSLSWHNPLLWGHYGDRHRGIALGFDVADAILKPVSYVEERPVLKEITLEVANWLLFTKYVDWQYEQEARIFTTLTDRDPESGLYFGDFSEQLLLREVIAGPLNMNTRREVLDAVGGLAGVTFTKSRLAFNSFRVVKDRRGFRR